MLRIGILGLAIVFLQISSVRADNAPPADDPQAAKMLKLPLAGKFAPGELFRVRTGERFEIEFRKADTIRSKCRVEVAGSPYIWTIDPTIVGANGFTQIKLDGYNPAAAHGTGIAEIQFTLRTDGLWLFVVFGEKSSVGCVELVEEKDKLIYLATTRKDGKVNGPMFQFKAKDLRDLRQNETAAKEFDKYVAPILELFGLGVS